MFEALIKYGAYSHTLHRFVWQNPEMDAISTLLNWLKKDPTNFKDFDKKSLLDKDVAARVANQMFFSIDKVSDIPSSTPNVFIPLENSKMMSKMIAWWIIKCIPPDQWAPFFTSKVLPHLPFVLRDPLLQQQPFDFHALLPSHLSFVESDPDVFIGPFARDLRAKQVDVMSHRSLYQLSPTDLEAGTQNAIYTAQRPTVLIIPSDQLHSGHNDLLQDRRWLGRKISEEVKILIVGDYSDLTADVQNRIEGEYMDEYSVKTEKPKTEPLYQ